MERISRELESATEEVDRQREWMDVLKRVQADKLQVGCLNPSF